MIAAMGKQLKQSVNVFHSLMLYRRLPATYETLITVIWDEKLQLSGNYDISSATVQCKFTQGKPQNRATHLIFMHLHSS